MWIYSPPPPQLYSSFNWSKKKSIWNFWSSNSSEKIRAIWNKRTSSNFGQILSYKSKPKMPNTKLFFVQTIDYMWCTTRLYLGATILFLLCINNLTQCLNKTKLCLFANNKYLTASGNSITDLEAQQLVKSDSENLQKELIAKYLSLTVAKFEFM